MMIKTAFDAVLVICFLILTIKHGYFREPLEWYFATMWFGILAAFFVATFFADLSTALKERRVKARGKIIRDIWNRAGDKPDQTPDEGRSDDSGGHRSASINIGGK